MIYEENYPQFFTATIYDWNHLLKEDKVKDIVVNSLRFLVKENRIFYPGGFNGAMSDQNNLIRGTQNVIGISNMFYKH